MPVSSSLEEPGITIGTAPDTQSSRTLERLLSRCLTSGSLHLGNPESPQTFGSGHKTEKAQRAFSLGRISNHSPEHSGSGNQGPAILTVLLVMPLSMFVRSLAGTVDFRSNALKKAYKTQ